MKLRFSLVLVSAVALAACSDSDVVSPTAKNLTVKTSVSVPTDGTYMLMSPSGVFDSNFSAAVTAAGGTLVSNHSGIGVAFATSSDPAFASRAAKIKGVQDVTPDLNVQWAPNESKAATVEASTLPPAHAAVVGGSDETFYNVQWNVPSIGADVAIAAGNTGAGARVAVLDGGVYRNHIDLAANIDQVHSRSFVPAGPNSDWFQDVGTFWHGTHVAGIIAAADNGIGTIGIAPAATIISVKVLQNGSGDFQWIIDGLIYAATPIAEGGAGADIVNMSLGATFVRAPNDGSNKLANALKRAVQYARSRGVLVIVAAGNEGVDMDHDSRVMSVPSQLPGVLSIAATGPVGWIPLGDTNFSRPAYYSNFGNSLIEFASPGGSDAYAGSENCGVATGIGTIVEPCWVFDMVMSTIRGTSTSGYSWADGTSMAAPAASGVAALIVGKFGHIGADAIEQKLRASATDVGKPGNDPYSGKGYVNAARAVQ